MQQSKMARFNFSDPAHACDAAAATTSVAPQTIYIANSPGFIAVAAILYASVAVALCLSVWSWQVMIIIELFLLLDFWRVLSAYGLRTASYSITNLCYVCGKWQYQLFSGKCYKARLIARNSFCSSWLLILCLRHMTGRRYVLIPRDAVSRRAYSWLAQQIIYSK